MASHDEDTTTMGVEAARLALRAAHRRRPPTTCGSPPPARPTWTRPTPPPSTPPSVSPAHVAAFDFGGALRSGVGALRTSLVAGGTGTTLVVVSDLRDGLPTSADESAGGDGAAAMRGRLTTGPGTPVIAEYLGGASVSDEFLDRWRTAGDRRSKVWEERFGETRYVSPRGRGLGGRPEDRGDRRPGRPRWPSPACTDERSRPWPASSVVRDGALADDLSTTVGQTGSAHAGLVLASMLEQAEPGQVVAVMSLADGADVLVFRTTDRPSDPGPPPTRWPIRSPGPPTSPTASSSPGGAW